MKTVDKRAYVHCFSSVMPIAFISVCILFLSRCCEVSAVGQVIWAVNCGGDVHVDSNGIRYQRDMAKVGFASEHGRSLNIRRIPPQDQILYQTERYHIANFAYDVPIQNDGDYVLVLKFSEVWFTEPGKKVFSVQLNQHAVIDHLDIFASSGFGIAHDELVPFSIRNRKLLVNDESFSFDGVLHVEFVKLNMDNPKINAIYVMKGRLEGNCMSVEVDLAAVKHLSHTLFNTWINNVPRLPPLPNVADRPSHEIDDSEEDESELGSESNRESRPNRERKRRGTEPRIADPYSSDDTSSLLIPIAAAIGIFIPVVFCLCKL